MSKFFKLIRNYCLNEEELWEYSYSFYFNGSKINGFTITNHYKIKHGRDMNNNLVCKIIELLDGENITPDDYSKRILYIWNTTYQNKRYRLIFWFKDNETSHLWIRNYYLIDSK